MELRAESFEVSSSFASLQSTEETSFSVDVTPSSTQEGGDAQGSALVDLAWFLGHPFAGMTLLLIIRLLEIHISFFCAASTRNSYAPI